MTTSRKPAKLNKKQRAGSRNTHSEKQTPKSGLPASRTFLICIPIIIVCGFLLEIALQHIPAQGTYIWGGCGAIIVAICPKLIDFVIDLYKDDPILKAPLAYDTNPWAEIWEKLMYLKKLICQDALCVILISAIFCSSGITAWATLQMSGRLLHAGKEFINYDSSTASAAAEGEINMSSSEQPLESRIHPEESSADEPAPESTTVQPPEIGPPEVSATSAANSGHTNTHSGQQNITVDASERAIAEKAQHMELCLPTMDWTLSNTEQDLLLFYSGDYRISSDCTPIQARDQVTAFLHALEQEQLYNTFDTQAPQPLKNDIAYASQHDAALQTSVEKDLIIKTRLDAYTLFGKETLAKLLAEDFHCYALAYKYYNEDWDTMINYYFQSLKWLYERLKYADLSEEARQEILISIRYRYNDIMTYSEWNSEQWARAKLLADAFSEIIVSYDR